MLGRNWFITLGMQPQKPLADLFHHLQELWSGGRQAGRQAGSLIG